MTSCLCLNFFTCNSNRHNLLGILQHSSVSVSALPPCLTDIPRGAKHKPPPTSNPSQAFRSPPQPQASTRGTALSGSSDPGVPQCLVRLLMCEYFWDGIPSLYWCLSAFQQPWLVLHGQGLPPSATHNSWFLALSSGPSVLSASLHGLGIQLPSLPSRSAENGRNPALLF